MGGARWGEASPGASHKEEFTVEDFERGIKPTLVQSMFDGKLHQGFSGIPEEMVMLFKEVRQLRADVTRLLALLEQRES